ncbi:MAG TPA: glycosyltransferase [Longimicrobiales bacterium]|nr:glycosyltransferase [Longimicrobiales bacterium]
MRGDHPPLVSVVMAVRNGERYLAEAVDSILGQTLDALELIAVDDGSADATPALLERYAAADSRVRVVRGGPRGLTASLIAGCALARGEFIARMDADDVAFPDRLARQVAHLRTHPAVAALGGAAIRIDAAGEPLKLLEVPATHAAIVEQLQRASALAHSAVTMRAGALAAVGGYRAAFRHAQDYDLWLRMAERFELANLSEPVIYYRVHDAQVSTAHLLDQTICGLAAQAAAVRRRATGADPIASDRPITRELLVELGVSEAAIDDAISGMLARVARLLTESGASEHAIALLRAGVRLPRGRTIAGPLLGAAYRGQVREHYRRRRLVRSAIATVRAARADPAGLVAALRRAAPAARPRPCT